jgi:hypothetical protein
VKTAEKYFVRKVLFVEAVMRAVLRSGFLLLGQIECSFVMNGSMDLSGTARPIYDSLRFTVIS